MSKAFLSYSSNDRELAEAVYRYLGKKNAIIDEKSFENGGYIISEIESRISQSDIIVFFISQSSLDSEWVQKEFQLSKDKFYLKEPNKIVPILVDKSIDIRDEKRLPEWLKLYVLSVNRRPHLIGKKIKQILRNFTLQSNTIFAKREKLFVGRNMLFDEFEERYLSFDDPEISSAIISGHINTGRRTFLRNAMRRVDLLRDNNDPIYITSDSKDNVDSIILKLKETIEEYSSEYLSYLSSLSFDQKVSELLKLIKEITDNDERIFIIDDGGVVKANKTLAIWFDRLIANEALYGMYSVSVISKYRVPNEIIRDNNHLFEINVPNLNPSDIKKLFVLYCKILGVHLDPNQSKKVLRLLTTNTPSQVHYAVEYIHQFGIQEALQNKSDIENFGTEHVNSIVKMAEEHEKFTLKILVLLCQFEFISFDLLYKIVGQKHVVKVNSSLNHLFVLGAYNLIGSNKEYIKVDPSVYNYIKRSQLRIDSEFKKNIKKSISDFIDTLDEDTRGSDFSELLFNIKGALSSKSSAKVPKRYYVPSFILKTVRDLYFARRFTDVIRLLDETLENPNRIDPDLIFDLKYWLCMGLARKRNRERFSIEVDFFADKGKGRKKQSSDFFYLHGFFARYDKRPDDAISYFEKAIGISSNFHRAKREIVNVYMSQQQYDKALEYARDNYLVDKNNAFQIQSYFTCLVKKSYLSDDDRFILKELLNRMKNNYNSKAPSFFDVMQEEYNFYIGKDKTTSIAAMKALVSSHAHRKYALYALREALKRDGRMGEYNQVQREIKKTSEFNF